MGKPLNEKVKDLSEGAASQEELMKSLAQIDEEGQLTDDVLDDVSGGALGKGDLKAIIGNPISPIGIPPTAGLVIQPVEPYPGPETF